MAKHDPDRVHWAKVLKIVTEAETKGIAVFDLAEELKKDHCDVHLDAALQQLISKGKIRMSMGRASTNEVNRIVNIQLPRQSARDRVGIPDKEDTK